MTASPALPENKKKNTKTKQTDSTAASNSRRRALKSAGLLSVIGTQLPTQWVAPLVDAVILPSHAQASNPTGGAGAGGNGKGNGSNCGRAANTQPNLCCEDIDPTSEQYATECCDTPARDASGQFLKDSAGRYICCENLDPTDRNYTKYCCKKRITSSQGSSVCCDDLSTTDPDYRNNCCDKKGKNGSGQEVTDAQGNKVCCDGLDVNDVNYQKYCCENTSKTATGQDVLDAQGNKVCCEGANKDPQFCCIKANVFHEQLIQRRRTTWKTGVSGAPLLEVPQWDPANGPLGRVIITASSNINFEVSLENIDASPSGIDVTISAEAKVKLTGPNGLEMKLRSPEINKSEHMPHGDEDAFNPKPTPFNSGGGSSVLILKDLGGSDSKEIVFTSAADLDAFIGNGIVNFHGDSWADNAVSADSGAGSGNVFSLVETFSDLKLGVIYECLSSQV